MFNWRQLAPTKANRKRRVRICGVYAILHRASGRCYIGSSVDVWGRFVGGHLKALARGEHSSVYLQRAWEKHGREAFRLLLLERCLPSTRFVREQWWMNLCLSYDYRYGFNVSRTATGIDLGSERRSEIARAHAPLLSHKAKKQWADPIIRAKMVKSIRTANAKRRGLPGSRKGCKNSPETRLKISLAVRLAITEGRRRSSGEKTKAYWADPEWKAGVLAKRVVTEKQRESARCMMKRLHADPVVRLKLLENARSSEAVERFRRMLSNKTREQIQKQN